MTLVEEVTAGVDWLTVRTDDEKNGADLLRLSWAILEEQTGSLPPPKEAKLLAYRGWRAGPLGFMANGQRCLLSLAGSLAQSYLKRVAEIEVTATRLDLAVDVLLFSAAPVAALRYAQLIREERAGTREGYKPKSCLITGSDGGSTLYLGNRSGRLFARLYDKGVQSGAAVSGTLWRYEVEYKQDAARAAYVGLLEADRQRDYILRRVHRHFQDRGVPPLFHVWRRAAPLERYKEATTPIDQLHWLKTQVAPTVGRLRLAGFEQDVYNVLGLPIPAAYKWKKDGD
jgi:DNA relaxase NicK